MTPEDRRELRALGFRMSLAIFIVSITAFVFFAMVPEARIWPYVRGFLLLFVSSTVAMILTRPR